MKILLMDIDVAGSSGSIHTGSKGWLARYFSQASIWVIAGLLCLVAFSAGEVRPAPIPVEAQRNHIVVLIDQSGSFYRLLGRNENRLARLINTTLPRILTDTDSLGCDSIYRRDRDVISIMLFGITTEFPDIHRGLLRDVFLFNGHTRLEDISGTTLGWRDQIAGLSAISAVFGSALDRIGREYRRLKLETVFNKTYLVRVSDDLHNSSGGFFNELVTIQLFKNDSLFPPDVLGFDSIYQKLSNCDSHVEIMNPVVTRRVSLKRNGAISWNEADFFRPSGDYPIKVLITEAKPRAHVSFDAIFESRTPAELKHYTKLPMSTTASFRLRPEYVQSYRELAPLGWRQDCIYKSDSSDLLWEAGGLNSLFPDSTVECEVSQKGDALPVSMVFTAFFGREDRYLGHGLFSVRKDVSYYKENLSAVDEFFMSQWPFEGWSNNWVYRSVVALLVLILLGVIFLPHKTVLSIEPLRKNRTRIVVDLNDSSEHPVIVGFANRHDTNYHRPRIRLSAKLKDFFYDLTSKRTSAFIRFGDNVATIKNTAELRNSIEPALAGPIKKNRFRSDEAMPLRLLPGSIVDLSKEGYRNLVGGGSVTRKSSVELDFDGRFGWAQGRRPTRYSSDEFRAKLVLRPRRVHARVEVHEVGPIEFACGRKQVVAMVRMENIDSLFNYNYVTDIDVTIEAELASLRAYKPNLGLDLVPAEVSIIAADLRASLEDLIVLRSEGNAEDQQAKAPLDRVESTVRRLLAERVLSLDPDSPIKLVVLDIISEIRDVVRDELQGVLALSRRVDTESLASPKPSYDQPSGSTSGIEEATANETPVRSDGSGIETVVERIEAEVQKLLNGQRELLIAPNGDVGTDSPNDAAEVGDTVEGKYQTDSNSFFASKDIRGRIPPRGLLLAVTVDFARPKNIKNQIDYDLHFRIPRGRDQLDLPGINKVKPRGLPVSTVTIIPSRKLATPRLDYISRGEHLRVENLMGFKRNDIIEVAPAGRHPKIVKPPGGDWHQLHNPILIIGNNARGGSGEVKFTIGYQDATVVTDIDSSNFRGAIEVHSLEVPSEDNIWAQANLVELANRTITYDSSQGDAHMELRFSIREDDISFPDDKDYVKVELSLPLTIELTNWKSDSEIPVEDPEMSGKENLKLKIPFVLHKEPARGLLSLDIGTSAIAAAYSDGGQKSVLLNLQDSLKLQDSGNKFFINNEPPGQTPFLSGPLGVYIAEEMEGSFQQDQLKYVDGATGIAFPAIKKFADYPDYLVSHLKMLLSSGVTSIRLGSGRNRVYQVQNLLNHALFRLLKDFVLDQVAKATGGQQDAIQKNLRRIVMTVPNTSLGHHAQMLREALPQDNGFRFAKDYIDFLSESDAAAYGYLYSRGTRASLAEYGKAFTLLVYDCGAGTLDLSLRTVNIEGGSGSPISTSSDLVSLLSVEGAGNALDAEIMKCVETVLRNAGESTDLTNNHGFRVNYYPFDTKNSIPDSLQSSWRDSLNKIKIALYYAKQNLSNDAKNYEINSDDLKLRIGFAQHTHRMFDVDVPDKAEQARLDTLNDYGITFAKKSRNPVVEIPYKTLQEQLDKENSEAEGHIRTGGFYQDHIDLPLEAILRGEENAKIWPDVVLLTGRTALFPGFSERLKKWFADELDCRERAADQADVDQNDIAVKPMADVAVPQMPNIVSFNEDPKEMKSIVVQGALKFANSSGKRFETTEVYGYYGLLIQEADQWKWRPVCNHHTIKQDKRNAGNHIPCGSCNIELVNSISFIYSSINPRSIIERYNADENRSFDPQSDSGPLVAYGHFLKKLNVADGKKIRKMAEEDAKIRGGLMVDSVEFYGAFTWTGRILNVNVQLRIGNDLLELNANAEGVSIGREQYSVWPYRLWTEA